MHRKTISKEQMKPLRDIGQLIEPTQESITQFETHIQMTLAERRELVRRVWDYFLESHGIIDINDRESDKFEKFLKREGL